MVNSMFSLITTLTKTSGCCLVFKVLFIYLRRKEKAREREMGPCSAMYCFSPRSPQSAGLDQAEGQI